MRREGTHSQDLSQSSVSELQWIEAGQSNSAEDTEGFRTQMQRGTVEPCPEQQQACGDCRRG